EPALPVGLSLTALAVLGAPVREGLQVRLLEIALEQAEQSRGLPGLELLKRGGVGAAVVVESVLTAPLGDHPVQVDVHDRVPHTGGEALGLPEQVPALVHEGLPVPGEVRRGLALAGGGVDVGALGA